MTINKEINGTELRIAVEGRLDTMTAPELEAELRESLDAAESLILDFGKLEYISSAGLRTILAAQQYLEEKDLPDVKVININAVVAEVFSVTGFDKLVDAEM